jgi:flavodoxin I
MNKMKKIGIFYGSTTGTTESVANVIARRLGIAPANVYNVSKMTAEMIAEYDVLLLGTSTWGIGELQDDWYDGIDTLKKVDLKGKTIAIFGCGDSESYPSTFCSAMAEIYNTIKDKGCFIVGTVPTDGYTYDDSDAVVDGQFVGLAIDEMNESDKTEARVESWMNEIKSFL